MDNAYAQTVRLLLAIRMTEKQRKFLIGLSKAQPDWSLLQCPHAAQLPALRWKLENLQTFIKRRPNDFLIQARTLEEQLLA
jgi:hypothetical protein